MQDKLAEFEHQLQIPSPLTQINDPLLTEQGVELWLKRDDLINPVVSGNKWRKLKYILRHALELKSRRIVSMGGAYSNHLHALAFAGRELGLETAAFIRGERPDHFSPTLLDLEQWGMQLNFVSRSDYRHLRDYKQHHSLPGLSETDYWLPEGGASHLALAGVAEIIQELEQPFDIVCCACGTGTTLAGLISAVPVATKVIGFAALKGGEFLHYDIRQLLDVDKANWHLQLDYHCGGFAKQNAELQSFMAAFETQHAIALDPVYTGKLLHGLYDMIQQGRFQQGQRILAIHSGGLQGRRSLARIFHEGNGIFELADS